MLKVTHRPELRRPGGRGARWSAWLLSPAACRRSTAGAGSAEQLWRGGRKPGSYKGQAGCSARGRAASGGAPCSALTSRSSPGAVPAGGTSASESGPALGPAGAGGDAGMPGVVCPRQGGARVQLTHSACASAPPPPTS